MGTDFWVLFSCALFIIIVSIVALFFVRKCKKNKMLYYTLIAIMFIIGIILMAVAWMDDDNDENRMKLRNGQTRNDISYIASFVWQDDTLSQKLLDKLQNMSYIKRIFVFGNVTQGIEYDNVLIVDMLDPIEYVADVVEKENTMSDSQTNVVHLVLDETSNVDLLDEIIKQSDQLVMDKPVLVGGIGHVITRTVNQFYDQEPSVWGNRMKRFKNQEEIRFQVDYISRNGILAYATNHVDLNEWRHAKDILLFRSQHRNQNLVTNDTTIDMLLSNYFYSKGGSVIQTKTNIKETNVMSHAGRFMRNQNIVTFNRQSHNEKDKLLIQMRIIFDQLKWPFFSEKYLIDSVLHKEHPQLRTRMIMRASLRPRR